ncbi:IclR family transcriptional regulator [Desulfurella sp.]|uniref:IclR family transcriptional regulator n=1 Tax=Desulfurella sp. TaxID=1962857 RepID=UPI0025C50C79|nr:IclR family transcriptional regulator [Desulfurella sp.]
MVETLTSIKKAFKIINCFTEREPELSLVQIYNKTSISKPSILRLCNTLIEEEFLVKDLDSGKYRLGPKMVNLWQIYNSSNASAKDIYAYLHKISKNTKETVTIYKREEFNRICFMRVDSPQFLKYSIPIGHTLPLHLGAGGKIILANLDKDLQINYFEQFKLASFYKNLEEFLDLLLKIKKDGYCISKGERDNFMAAAAAPLFKYNKIFGSLSISGPKDRFLNNFSNEKLYLLIQFAEKISKLIESL